MRRFWDWLFGRKAATSNVTFNERDRVEPTLQMVRPGLTIGQVELRGYDLYRWTKDGWVFACRMPKQAEVRDIDDLPPEAPFNYCYVIGTDTWCWDGACWVKNDYKLDIKFDGRTNNVTRRQVNQVHRASQLNNTGSEHRVVDPHPTDSGMIATGLLITQIMDSDFHRTTPSPQGGTDSRLTPSHSSSHSRHDDSPSHSNYHHDTDHHTTSPSGYDGGYDGGGGFSD
jgi:hypothetical protein